MKWLAIALTVLLASCNGKNFRYTAEPGKPVIETGMGTSITIRKNGQKVNYEIPAELKQSFAEKLNGATLTGASNYAPEYFVGVYPEDGDPMLFRTNGASFKNLDAYTYTVADASYFDKMWKSARADAGHYVLYVPMVMVRDSAVADSALLSAKHLHNMEQVLDFYGEAYVDSADALYVDDEITRQTMASYTAHALDSTWLLQNIK